MTFKYTFSVGKTNTRLHGIPSRRVRTFYFFRKSPTVPTLMWIKVRESPLLEYLKDIPKTAAHQDWYITDNQFTERFKSYKFTMLQEGLSYT